MTNKPLVLQRMNVVTEIFQKRSKSEGKIFVYLDLYRKYGTPGMGRSSWAEAAAKAMAD
jgi:hypothetical protein